MLCHGPNANPPERPAITHRNEPPELVAVNPSWDVVPKGPSTTPPPRTAGPDEATAEGASVVTAANSNTGAMQRRSRAAAIRPPAVGGVAMGPMAGSWPYSPAAGAKGSVDGRASRLEAANVGAILPPVVHPVNRRCAPRCLCATGSRRAIRGNRDDFARASRGRHLAVVFEEYASSALPETPGRSPMHRVAGSAPVLREGGQPYVQVEGDTTWPTSIRWPSGSWM